MFNANFHLITGEARAEVGSDHAYAQHAFHEVALPCQNTVVSVLSPTRVLVLSARTTSKWYAAYLFAVDGTRVKLVSCRIVAFPTPGTGGNLVCTETVIDATHVFVGYRVTYTVTTANYGGGVIIDLTNDRISVGPEVITLVAPGNGIYTVGLSAAASLCVYHTAGNVLAAKHIAHTTSVITPGVGVVSAFLVASSQLFLAQLSATEVVCVATTGTNSFQMVDITLTGTTPAFGTASAAFTLGTPAAFIATSATGGLIAYYNQTTSVFGVVPWSVAAGVFTLGTAKTFVSGTFAQFMSMCQTSGTSALLLYIYSTTYYRALIVSGNGTVVNTFSAITGVPVPSETPTVKLMSDGRIFAAGNGGAGINGLSVDVFVPRGATVA
jgi:hypothetical protein